MLRSAHQDSVIGPPRAGANPAHSRELRPALLRRADRSRADELGRAEHNKAVWTASRSRSCDTACAPIRQGSLSRWGTLRSSRYVIPAMAPGATGRPTGRWVVAVARLRAPSQAAGPEAGAGAMAGGPAAGSWVGPGRPARIAPGGFPRPARRTRRATLTAPGAPRVLPAGVSWLPGPAGVPTGPVFCCRGSGSG